MGTHNICLYIEVDKKYSGSNLKTTELLDCALIGVCAVIRSNMVFKLTSTVRVYGVEYLGHAHPCSLIRAFTVC